MAAPPPVTVITATYNWPSVLALAMRTVLEQAFGDFEYLVIGDACTDETEDLVRSVGDPRLRWINLAENTGNQSGVNKVGVAAARGELIAYLNQDDLWFPDHLQLLTDAARNRDLDIVSSVALEISPPPSTFCGLFGLPYTLASGLVDVYAQTTCVMHTKAASLAVGGWRDWREIASLPTQDFFRRIRDLRRCFEVVPELTALKFHSADRPGSYVDRTATEQQRYYEAMHADPQLRYRESLRAATCHSLGQRPPKIAHPPAPEVEPPGWQIEQWRRIRGLPPMIDLGDTEPGPAWPRRAAPT
jgi:glycosyltransferase involved in cell wall biosynthesis